MMKIKSGFQLRQIAGASVVVATGDAAKSFSGIINLNDTAATLFEKLLTGATREELIATLTSEYEVTADKAAQSVDRFIEELQKADLLQ